MRAIARELAQKPYKAPDNKLPDALKDLTYDRYRMIRFQAGARALAQRGPAVPAPVLPSRLLLREPRRHLRGEGRDRDADRLFAQHVLASATARRRTSGSNLGFAGFRIHGPINRPDYFDEIGVFLGASYFRAVAKGQTYGLSARGLVAQHRRSEGRGVPELPFVLGRAPRKGRKLDRRARAARQRERGRGLSLHHPARRDHDLRHRGDAVPARADRADRTGDAHQHVFLRRQRSRRRRRLPPRGPRLRRRLRSRTGAASRSGGR